MIASDLLQSLAVGVIVLAVVWAFIAWFMWPTLRALVSEGADEAYFEELQAERLSRRQAVAFARTRMRRNSLLVVSTLPGVRRG